MSNQISRYLYACYCGPIRLREDQKTKHPGYIYDNCPRITAPVIDTKKISEIKDIRIQKFYNNLYKYIDLMKEFGVREACLVGSFVRNQHSHFSDIDILVLGVRENEETINSLTEALNEIDGLSFDIVPKSHTLLMPHMQIPKGDQIILFDTDKSYIYNEQAGNVWTR